MINRLALVFLSISIFFAYCTSGKKSTLPGPVISISEAEANAGLELIAQSDCLTCHKIEERSIGPAYKQVSLKYTATETTINKLVEKVFKGGSGVWGDVPMTPHNTYNKADIRKMVLYVLSLRKNS